MNLLQSIERTACDFGPQSPKALISVETALSEIRRNVRPISETETVALGDAVGRVLSHQVRSRGMVPPFSNAAMDGFAINTADLVGRGPWQFKVTARISAGDVPSVVLARGCAAQVFTGAQIPDGANAVVMQENVQPCKNGIRLAHPIDPGTHIRAAGEDMTAGKIALRPGRVLTAADIAVSAAAGHGQLTVYRPLRVALLVTGDEVRQNENPRGSAGIWDVNTPMLAAAIASPTVCVRQTTVAGDNKATLVSQLDKLGRSVDLIVTTGGISVGEEDHVKPALSELGARLVFSGVALKPGKPVSFGHIGGTYWLGLPGNPLAALLTWHQFGRPLCRSLIGASEASSMRRNVVLSQALHHKRGRCELRLAQLLGFDNQGREVVDFAETTHSGRVASLPNMDGFLHIPADAETLPKGAFVEFQPF